MIRILSVFITILLALPAVAQNRHALVVGIDAYTYVAPLQKARNDASAVGDALESAGFEVRILLDPERRALLSAFASFTERLRPGDEAVFYFAGHGVEVGGRNVLLAADIPALTANEAVLLDSEGLPVDRVLAAIQSRGARASVLIIDACRDNPFPDDGLGRSLGGTRGLVPVKPPEGAMVVFSAGTGQEALDRLSNDDPNPNSIFTRELLPFLTTPGLPLHEAARRLRNQVEDLALSIDHRQRPAIYDEMRGDFILVPAVAEVPLATSTETATAALPADPCSGAREDWAAIAQSESRGVLEAFIAAHPVCSVQNALAEARLAALAPPATTGAGGTDPQSSVTNQPDWTRAIFVTLDGHARGAIRGAFSADGRRVVTTSADGSIRLWNAQTGRELANLDGFSGWHHGWVASAVFSPDGRRIAAPFGQRHAKIWDAETGREIAVLHGHSDWLRRVAFSPDGKRVVTASDDLTTRIWDAVNGREIATLHGLSKRIHNVAFSPDGERVFTVSERPHVAQIWDARTGREIVTRSFARAPASSATFSPDGQKILATFDDGSAHVWDTESGRLIAKLHTDAYAVNINRGAAFSPDGQRVVAMRGLSNNLSIWDAMTGREIVTLIGHSATIHSFEFSPDGRRVATASGDRTVRIWNAETGRSITMLSGHESWVNSATWSPDGQRIITASNDGTARIWSAR